MSLLSRCRFSFVYALPGQCWEALLYMLSALLPGCPPLLMLRLVLDGLLVVVTWCMRQVNCLSCLPFRLIARS